MPRALPLLGFGLPVSGPWATPDLVRHVALRAEELGYASLWTYQRLLSPVGADLEPGHQDVLDPLVALTYAAAHTSRIGLGTATICAPLIAPVHLAKATRSLDVLSGGRLTVGIGSGWLPEEFTAAGIPIEGRGARLEEYVRCLVALWTQDPVEFVGEHYTVPRSHQGPRPVQQPHPPLLLGGTAPAALRRAGRLAQGWVASSKHDLEELTASVALVRARAVEAGRDPDALRIVLRVLPELVDHDPGAGRRPFCGTSDQILDDLSGVAEHGVTEAIVDLNLTTRSRTAEGLEDVDRVLEAFRPS